MVSSQLSQQLVGIYATHIRMTAFHFRCLEEFGQDLEVSNDSFECILLPVKRLPLFMDDLFQLIQFLFVIVR